MLVQIECAMNNTMHCSAKQSPSKLLFGVNQGGVDVDFLIAYLQENSIKKYCRDIERIEQRHLNLFKKISGKKF